MMKISNRKILALLLVMLMSGSGGVYAANAGNRTVTRVPRPNMTKNVRAPRPVQTGNNTSARSASSTAARTFQLKEVLYVMIGNPLKSEIPIYTSLTSGKVARYFNVNEVGHGEDNAYFLDIYIYNNGYAEVTYFDKQYKDRKIYVKASDLSMGSGVFRVNNLPVQTASVSTPLYTDASKSKVMYNINPGRTYKVLAQQGNMQQIYSYGKGQYSAIGWISIASSSNGSTNGSRISSTGLRGDINGDGQVNSNDLALLKQYLNNSSVTINKADADMNNDGAIDVADYNSLVYFLNPRQPVLKGDVNGDGKIDETDYKLLNQFISGQKVSNFYHYNADMNNDKKFTTTDLSQLRSKVHVTPSRIGIKEGLYSIQPMCAPNAELTVYNASKNLSTPVVISSQGSGNQTTKSHQKWFVVSVGNGYYKITAENSGLALNNHNGANVNGNPISIYTYSGFCQEFAFYDAGNGYYIIQPKNVSGVLDVAGGGNANNTRVQLYQYNGTAAQKWKLVPRNRGVDPDPPKPYQTWEATPKRTCNVYTDSALTQRTPGVNEYVDTSDPVTVLGEKGNAYYIRYKARSGYKDRWVTKDIFKEPEIIPNDLAAKFKSLQGKYPAGTKYLKNYCSDGYKAKECHGYALQLRIDLTGKNPMKKCRKIKDRNAINNLQAGDLIRYRNDGHTILVTAVNGEDVTYTDCNWNHDKAIRWNVHITKQKLRDNFHVYSGSNDYVMKYNG